MTLLERAAAAVREELGDYAVGDMWMAEGGLRGEDHYRGIVRAALTAIREPSEAMENACYEEIEAQGGNAWSPFGLWRAMIDAALAEGE